MNAPPWTSPQSPSQPSSGTIAKIEAQRVIVKLTNGNSVPITLNQVYFNNAPAAPKDLKAGMPIRQEQEGVWAVGPPMSGPPKSGPSNPGSNSGQQTPMHKPGPPMKPGQAQTGSVFRVEQGVKANINLSGSMIDVPWSEFENPQLLAPNCIVLKMGPNHWKVTSVQQTAPPKPGVVSGPKVITKRGSGMFVIKALRATGVAAQEDNNPPSVEIPIENIYLQEGAVATIRQLAVGFRLQIQMPQQFLLLDPPVEERKEPIQMPSSVVVSNYQSVSKLAEIYQASMTPGLQLCVDFAINKYAAIYYAQSESPSRSVAAYLFQCVLFEQTCLYQSSMDPSMQSGRGAPSAIKTPITDQYNFSQFFAGGVPLGISVIKPEFEGTWGEFITFIDQTISGWFRGPLDFYALANNLQVCLTVLMPNTESYNKWTCFPQRSTGDVWQHIVILGLPPFPVLIKKKMQPLLEVANPESHSVKYKHYIYKKVKVDPPKIDPLVAENSKKLTTFTPELTSLSLSLLTFCESMINRFDQLIRAGTLGSDYASSKLGQQLGKVYIVLRTLPIEDQTAKAKAFEISQNMIEKVWKQFTQKCAAQPCENFREITLECSHYLCDEHFQRQIQAAQSQGTAVSPTSESTSITCICGRPVSAQTLKAYDSMLFDRLKMEGEGKLGLYPCSVCSKSRPSKIMLTAYCGHYVCGICAGSQAVMCKTCNASLTGLLGQVEQSSVQCDACQQMFGGKMINPGMCGIGHVLCPSCSFNSVKSRQCAVNSCQAPLDHATIELMKSKAMTTCPFCQLFKTVSEFEPMDCPCVICSKCTLEFIKKTGNYTTCWGCGHPLNQELAKKLFEKSGLGQAKPCASCGGTNPQADIVFNCGCAYHSNHLFELAQQCIFAKPQNRLLCPGNIEIYADKIPNWWSYYLDPSQPAPSELVMFQQANPPQYEIHCPFCGNNEEGVEINRTVDRPYSAKCEKCDQEYCVLCQEKWGDQYHAQEMCKIIMAWHKIAELEKQHIQAIQCPGCKMAQPKSTNLQTEWQQCEACTMYFCSECAARYDAIKIHGGSYHREDCDYRTAEFHNSDFSAECGICNMQGGEGCTPPKRLARKGQFSPNEQY